MRLINFSKENTISIYNGTDWTNYTSNDGILFNEVNAMDLDIDGNKWYKCLKFY